MIHRVVVVVLLFLLIFSIFASPAKSEIQRERQVGNLRVRRGRVGIKIAGFTTREIHGNECREESK